MQNFYTQVAQWLDQHDSLLLGISLSSIAFFFLSLAIIPWVIVKLPNDYFANISKGTKSRIFSNTIVNLVATVFRNTIGFTFILLGVALLVLPGQGLLTILLGVGLADFPGKTRLIKKITSKRSVQRSLNWVREKGGKTPFTFMPDDG